LDQPRLVSVNARLASQELGIDVEIRLRQLDGRWLAVAHERDALEHAGHLRRGRTRRGLPPTSAMSRSWR
jgi:hypothetical protein